MQKGHPCVHCTAKTMIDDDIDSIHTRPKPALEQAGSMKNERKNKRRLPIYFGNNRNLQKQRKIIKDEGTLPFLP